MSPELLSLGSDNASGRSSAGSVTRKWLRRTSITAGIAVLSVGAAGAVSLGMVNSNIERADLMSVSAAAMPQSSKDTLNIVIMGASPDPDQTETGRGDVVMVLHISADRQSAQLVSFPRATYVNVPGKGMNALNASYVLGGPQLTVKTLESLTKTRMDHVVMASYEGFTSIAKQVGSVTVDNEQAFTNGGHKFAKGEIALTSEQALAYVKVREDGKDDAGDREERQRVVLEASLQAGLNRDVLSSPTKLAAFIQTATKNTTVDQRLTSAEITKIALSLRLSREKVGLVRVPLTGKEITVKGKDVQKVDSEQFAELSTSLSQDTLGTYVEKYPTT